MQVLPFLLILTKPSLLVFILLRWTYVLISWVFPSSYILLYPIHPFLLKLFSTSHSFFFLPYSIDLPGVFSLLSSSNSRFSLTSRDRGRSTEFLAPYPPCGRSIAPSVSSLSDGDISSSVFLLLDKQKQK